MDIPQQREDEAPRSIEDAQDSLVGAYITEFQRVYRMLKDPRSRLDVAKSLESLIHGIRLQMEIEGIPETRWRTYPMYLENVSDPATRDQITDILLHPNRQKVEEVTRFLNLRVLAETIQIKPASARAVVARFKKEVPQSSYNAAAVAHYLIQQGYTSSVHDEGESPSDPSKVEE